MQEIIYVDARNKFSVQHYKMYNNLLFLKYYSFYEYYHSPALIINTALSMILRHHALLQDYRD